MAVRSSWFPQPAPPNNPFVAISSDAPRATTSRHAYGLTVGSSTYMGGPYFDGSHQVVTLASWASEALTAGLYQSARGLEVRAGGREVLLLMVGLLSSPSAGFRGLALRTLNLSARGREVLAGGREVRLRIVDSALFPIHHSTISKVFPATTPAWLTCGRFGLYIKSDKSAATPPANPSPRVASWASSDLTPSIKS